MREPPDTRIIVKNLGRHVTKERVQQKFSEFGTITDVRMAYTEEKVFRGFVFIGFKEATAAQAAIKKFNKTYFDTKKMDIQIAKTANDDLARPWSKYSKGSSKHKRLNPGLYEQEKDKEVTKPIKTVPQK